MGRNGLRSLQWSREGAPRGHAMASRTYPQGDQPFQMPLSAPSAPAEADAPEPDPVELEATTGPVDFNEDVT